jgi:glycosyltransferase involved in cell wall biosynthesis
LHNYRWLCPNALFYRDGHTCEDCLSTAVPWPAIVHACYRDSHVQSAAVATVLVAHRFLESFSQAVDAFIALTEFAREKFVGAGLPEDAIHVKPNFLLPDPGVGPAGGDYVLFVGRLSIEKGVHTLLEAWRNLDGIPLKIAGDGPLLEEARRLIDDWKLGNVELLGHRTPEELIDLYKGARFLVFPSECYENLPVTLAEAYASGLPVIGSRIGSIAEIVQDGVTGILFAPGDAHELADASARLWNNADVCERLSLGARLEFESKYEAGGNYQSLMKIYDYAIRHAERRANG